MPPETAYWYRAPEAPEVPLLVSIPHTGTEVPVELKRRFASSEVAGLPDTDWHLHTVYDFVPALGGRTLYARWSRYVIDLNRDPDSKPLYPGRFETGLVPTTTFDGKPLYAAGREPDDEEIADRRERYWAPYHARLRAELDEIVARHGYALLFEAHSIRSEVPKLFEGRLPDLVLGDADGSACPKEIVEAVRAVHENSPFESAHNRPFKGGFITRAFGGGKVHALQLEMAQAIYTEEEPPFPYVAQKVERLRPTLQATLEAFVAAGARLHG